MYGEGRIFVDLTMEGVVDNDKYDNQRMGWNTLIWLKNDSYEVYQISVDGSVFDVEVTTTSVISSFSFKGDEKSITFKATGLLGTEGYTHLIIPQGIMWGDPEEWRILVDDHDPKESSYITTEGTNYHVHIFYDHSTHDIKITSPEAIPEFPSTMLLLTFLLLITTLLTLIKKEHNRKTKP